MFLCAGDAARTLFAQLVYLERVIWNFELCAFMFYLIKSVLVVGSKLMGSSLAGVLSRDWNTFWLFKGTFDFSSFMAAELSGHIYTDQP